MAREERMNGRKDARAQTWTPTWSQHQKSIHLNYELPHRIHHACVYPRLSPNGSTIIIYGTAYGVTIVWRGGRQFKTTSRPQARQNEIISIDSDDDDQPQNSAPEFEEEEPEYDPDEPFEQIVHTEEIDLESGVLRIATPDLPSSSTVNTEYSLPPILREHIVFSAACEDGRIALFSVGITPSRQGVDVNEIVVIDAQSNPAAVSQGSSLTWTGKQHLRTAHGEEERPPEWSFLIANYTFLAGGVLSVYQVNLNERGAGFARSGGVTQIQEEYLQHQVDAVSFNTSQYPSRRHTQILVATAGAVRVYEPCPKTRLLHHQTQSQQGSWLISLHVPFESPSNQQTIGKRSRILDARWALDGQCILALLGDGQWGVWDIEGTAPITSDSTRRVTTSSSSSGVSGGGITRFALRGYIGDNAALNAAKLDLNSIHHSSKEAKKLTPMTPNTRKLKQQALFTGPRSTTHFPGLPRGGISISALPSSKEGAKPDDAVVLWYEHGLYAIPSLQKHWQRVINGTGKISSLERVRDFSTYSEEITNVSQAPLPAAFSNVHSTSAIAGIQQDIVVSTDHRLLMLCPERLTPQTQSSAVRRLFGTASGGQEDTGDAGNLMDLDEEDVMRMDQDMLSKGQLDLGGLDRMLSGMDGIGSGSFSRLGNGGGNGGGGGGLFGNGSNGGFGRQGNGGGNGSLFGNGNGGDAGRTRRVGFKAGY